MSKQNGVEAWLASQEHPLRSGNLLCKPGIIPNKSQLIKFSKSESPYVVQQGNVQLFLLIFQFFLISWVLMTDFQKLVTT